MKTIVFDTHKFERDLFRELEPKYRHEISYLEVRLTEVTAPLAKGFPAICAFAHDDLSAGVLKILAANGTELIALRSAGFNHVDLKAAKELKLRVVRVPEYSPYSVAEFAMGLVLSLNRKIHKAYHRVRDLNFSLDGMMGFDLHGKTVGIIGTGRIGMAFTQICLGFGCRCLAFDLRPNPELIAKGVEYVDLPTLYSKSDILSLHVPLNAKTRHLINDAALAQMKKTAILVNTGRGALIDTAALIRTLKQGKLGAAGLDVYEEEESVFFYDLSEKGLLDDQLVRLLTFPNVLITSHQAFLTHEAVHNIVDTTLANISAFETRKEPLANEVSI